MGYKTGQEESEAINQLWDDQVDWVEGGKNWSEGERV